MGSVFRNLCSALCALALLWSGISAFNDEDGAVNVTSKRWYPRYHLAPPRGWMNDPNGLVHYDGYFHAFYQHDPNSVKPGLIHWGHARSRDLMRWEHLPVALTPSGPDDGDGCFSGSAVVDNGTLSLLYTGNRYIGEPKNDDNLYQVQCLATSKDGIKFEKKGKVIDTPKGLHHFRDPKVWREADRWWMILGARVNGSGQVLLYSSSDLRRWSEEGVLTQAEPSMGYMWECPDFYPLGGKRILMFSPQGIEPKGYEYRNLYQSGYIVGKWNPKQSFVRERNFVEMDRGHDFYAPQSFAAPDGRRIVIAWLDMWESIMPEQQDGWAGMFSLPREVSLTKDNRLKMRPIKEVESLRKNRASWKQTSLKDEQKTLASDCEAMEVVLRWDSGASTAEQYGVSIGSGARVYADAQSQRLVLERNYPKLGLVGTRSVPLPTNNPVLELRLFVDRSSLEVFVNDGEATISSRIYPNPGERELRVFAWSGPAVLKDAEAWNLL